MQVEVFVPGAGADYEVDGIQVHRFSVKHLPSNILPFLFSRRNEKSFLHAVTKAGILGKDIVVCHGNTANFAIYPLAVKRLNPQCKTLLQHHDLASFGLNLGVLHKCALYNAWLFRKLRALHEQIDCHVFISEASRRSFLAAPDAGWTVYGDYKAQMRGPKAFGCRPARITESIVLHNGVDVGLFKRLAVGGERGEFEIGCVGNFERLKDQMTLLEAVEIVNRKECASGGVGVVFVGSGPERAKCEAYANERGLDVEFRDEVKHEELPHFYREVDLFVLPSYFEGFGCVYTEAWACGVPFIACEGSGVADLIAAEDRGKWLCKPQEPKDLATKIASYIENKWTQKLTNTIDIDELVKEFCKQLCIL